MPPPTWIVREGRDPFRRLAEIVPRPSLVVDGGANKGRTVARFLELFAGARVLAYEPDPVLVRKLTKRFAAETRVDVRAAALGSEPGVLRLNVLESRTCSSLLAPEGIADKHPGKPMGLTCRVDVAVVRLDQDAPHGADILKLDLQGYELEALRGAQGLLPGLSAVLCEVSFASLYRGQPDGGEVVDWMTDQGFELEGLYCPWRGQEDCLLAADALFRRRDLAG